MLWRKFYIKNLIAFTNKHISEIRKDYPNIQGERNVLGKNTWFYLGTINTD